MIFKLKIFLILIPFQSFSLYSQNLSVNKAKIINDSIHVAGYLKIIEENEQENPIKSYLYIGKIETYSKENNYLRGIIIAKKERAFLYYNQQKYDDAILELQNEYPLIFEMSTIEQARFYNLKGVIFQAKEETDSSLHYLNTSLKLYEQTNDYEGIVTSLSNIGISLYNSGLTAEALQHFEDAYNLCLELKNYKNLPEVMNNYAVLLLNIGETKKAEKLFKSLLKDEDLSNNFLQKASLLLNWASYKKMAGQNEDALKWYQKSLEYSLKKNIPISPNIYIGLGQVYLSKNNPSKALLEFYKSLNSIPSYSEKKMIYKGLADSHSELRTQDSVGYYWEKLNALIEKKYKKEYVSAIANAQKNVINYKKDVDIQLLTKDNKILTQKNRSNNLIILSLLLIGLLVLSVIYWYRRQQKLKSKQLTKEMEIKKQGLVTYALKIIQKNQLLYDLKEKTSEVELEGSDKLSALQKEISLAITNSAHNDKDWEQFEVYFNDIYQGFYKRLKEKFPELTDNDLRICSLVKLRFTIKEISNLLFSSSETIKSTRYRIRKKLNLLQEENLTDFLNEI